jgi:hypothetical protein
MFRITDPSSGSLVHCLAKNYRYDFIVSVDMDKVGVMAAYSDPLCTTGQNMLHSVFGHSRSQTERKIDKQRDGRLAGPPIPNVFFIF